MSKRMIHSRMWQSETVAKMSYFERVLWIGMITAADDQGRLRANPALVRSTVFPFEDVPLSDIEDALQHLVELQCATAYQVKGIDLIQIINWWDYQDMQWATASVWPLPEGWTDRVRCRAKGKYFEQDWNSTGGFHATTRENSSPEPSPEPSPEKQGEKLPEALGLSDSDSDSDSINTLKSGADAPAAEQLDVLATCHEYLKTAKPKDKPAAMGHLYKQRFVGTTHPPNYGRLGKMAQKLSGDYDTLADIIWGCPGVKGDPHDYIEKAVTNSAARVATEQMHNQPVRTY